ncbi:hypothetical protein P43SY_006802 [Pythium insidiosum]|uniref:M96 mating-specific protein family n=1 Tax=Pythium insidiosum TaxID=114742 RepID=A0AAD5MBY1_PYTIN|nr:hypothetical protein P43SY_006802 [Pythium insidiosum]
MHVLVPADDDQRTLQAALEFLDGYADDDNLFSASELDAFGAVPADGADGADAAAPPAPVSPSLGPSPSPIEDELQPATPTAASGASGGGPSNRRVRKRQKDELIYLRCRVRELEDRLARLQQSAASRGASAAPLSRPLLLPASPARSVASTASTAATSEDESRDERPSSQLISVWESVAARQYEQRQQAEVENVKLKEMLEEQIRVARSLERILKKRSHVELLQSSRASTKRLKWLRTAHPSEDAAMLDDMMRRLQAQYAQSAAIFADPTVRARGPIFRDVQVKMAEEDGVQEMYVNVLDCKILPFELREVADAFWQHLVGISERGVGSMNTLERQTHELTDDSIVRSFLVEMRAGPMKGQFRGKKCVRRFREDGRVVIVWSMLSEPLELSGELMGGLLLRQRAWIEFTPSAADPTQATQMRARYVMTPDVYDDEAPDHERKVGAVTDFVIHSVHGTLNATHQMIENVLLQSRLEKRP